MDAVFGSSSSLTRHDANAVDLPRAASYNDFSTIHDTHSDTTSNDGTRDSSSIEDSKTGSTSVDNVSPSSSGTTTPDSEVAPSSRKAAKRQADHLRRGLPKLATSDVDRSGGPMTAPPTIKTPISSTNDDSSDLPAQSSNHLSARLRRRSWMPSSRSPSPGRKRSAAEGLADTLGKASSAVRRSSPFRRSPDPDQKNTNRSRSTSLSRTISSKLQRRPTTALVEDVPKPFTATTTKPSQLSKSFSTDKLSLSSFTRSKDAPPVPRLTSKEKQRLANPEAAKKRDELWNAFRNLDAEHQKYIRNAPFWLQIILTIAQISN